MRSCERRSRRLRCTPFTAYEQLPVHQIDFSTASGRAEHDGLVRCVERIISAKRATPNADTTALEREIDERIYRLYGLTPEEIRLVEGANAP